MAVNLNVVIGGVAKVVAATSYPFPKKGNLPADYTLTLKGEKAVLARTGGGTYPAYIYVMIDGKSHYLPKNVTPDAGSDMTVIATPIGATLKVPAEKKVLPSGDALKKELADAGVTVEQAIEAARVIEAEVVKTVAEAVVANAEVAKAKSARRKAAK